MDIEFDFFFWRSSIYMCGMLLKHRKFKKALQKLFQFEMPISPTMAGFYLNVLGVCLYVHFNRK